jgi:hypothetical protein
MVTAAIYVGKEGDALQSGAIRVAERATIHRQQVAYLGESEAMPD